MSGAVILVGGGLANCLIALRLRALRPDVSLTLLEGADHLGGNHTWSFHGTDVAPAALAWLRPLASYSWSHHDVKFPARERRLSGSYYSLTSERLHATVMAALGGEVRLNTPVGEVAADRVTLTGGEQLRADLVVDGRGLSSGPEPGVTLRFQKFLGQLLRLSGPHGLTGPLLMDATVAQEQGYRFVYLLPFAPTELLVEDTYYSDTGTLDTGLLRQRIARYATDRGWRVEAVLREEQGVLPIVLDCDLAAFWPERDGIPRSGLRAGLFHHTTGYSLPEAAGLAEALAGLPGLGSDTVGPWIRERVRRRWREQRVFRLLNRMLFLGAAPGDRYRVLEHFYRLPESVIDHFYAGRLTPFDVARVLTGTPPIPVRQALRYILPSSSRSPGITTPLKAPGR
ncbi:MAG: lycopene beta-cyclase CrtY [Gammaproteobacteria bacterium]